MNSRERFLATMSFEKPDRAPFLEFGYWSGAVRRWYREGLSWHAGIPTAEEWPDGRAIFHNRMMGAFGSPDDRDVMDCLGMDRAPQRVQFKYFLYPEFPERILEDRGATYVWSDADGALKLESKDRSSMPQWLGWAVSNMEDWQRVKAERLRFSLEGRLPANWDELVVTYRDRDFPLILGDIQGFYGSPRRLLGAERVLYAFYDHPELIRDMINYLADFWIALYDQVLRLVQVDAALIWEDMCYKGGPLISPAMFREFLLPAYKKLIGFLRERGVSHVIVDTDGDCRKLLPLFVEAGVTAVLPFEVTGGQNVVEVRETFPHLGIAGGIDKQALAAGPRAIDEELETKLPFMLQHRGYIPCVDHTVPPDVSWDNFAHYRQRLQDLCQQA